MSDVTSTPPLSRGRREPGWEYRIYFVPVFAVSLPIAALRALGAAIQSDATPRKGIIADAWQRARDVTTTICSV